MKIVKGCYSSSAICKHFGLQRGAGNYNTIKIRLTEDNVDISHFVNEIPNQYVGYNKRKSVEEYLKSTWIETKTLKKKLLEEGIFKEECFICNQGPEWNNKRLVLQMDHIDGDSDNNDLKNLRIICPNCHTQTPTYSGKRNKKKSNCCIDCNKDIRRRSTRCNPCNSKHRNVTPAGFEPA